MYFESWYFDFGFCFNNFSKCFLFYMFD